MPSVPTSHVDVRCVDVMRPFFISVKRLMVSMSLTDGGCTSSLPGSEIDCRESSPASKTRRPDESRNSPADGSEAARQRPEFRAVRHVRALGPELEDEPVRVEGVGAGELLQGVGAAHRGRGDARDVIGAVRDEATPAVANPPRLVDDRRRLELRASRGERRVAAEEGRAARCRHLDRLRGHAPGPFKEVGIVDVRRVESVAALRQRLLAHAPSQRRQRAGVVRGQRRGRERPRGRRPADAVAERLAPRALSWWRCGGRETDEVQLVAAPRRAEAKLQRLHRIDGASLQNLEREVMELF